MLRQFLRWKEELNTSTPKKTAALPAETLYSICLITRHHFQEHSDSPTCLQKRFKRERFEENSVKYIFITTPKKN